jgi:hypothetical protein
MLCLKAKNRSETRSQEKEVWEAALSVPVADEEGGQVIPTGYHVAHVADV